MHGYNFTDHVRYALSKSRDEAARLHHEYVGTEHVLLGLTYADESLAMSMLQNLNVDIGDLRDRVESVVKKGRSRASSPADLPYTSRAKKLLELAMSEARDLGHSYVGTEHLLLGLMREGKGIAAQVMSVHGLTEENLRAELLRLLGTDAQSHREPSSFSSVVVTSVRPKRATVLVFLGGVVVGWLLHPLIVALTR